MKRQKTAARAHRGTRTASPPPSLDFDLAYRRQAERQALALLERNQNLESVARLFPLAAAELERSGEECQFEAARDYAATLRYAAAIASVDVLRREVTRLGGDPDKLLGVQP